MPNKPPVSVIPPRKLSSSPILQDDVTEINGVSLLTKRGRWKSRFTDAERLKICSATKWDLKSFVALFCPLKPYYIETRRGEPKWKTPKTKSQGFPRLTDSKVLSHLAGDVIPTQAPMWIGTKCWDWTTWVGIDIDHQGDDGELDARCCFVEKSLMVLGIPRKHLFTTRTPSGGWHYFFFLKKPTKAKYIPTYLGHVGLFESRGQIELFPRANQGMRLPFGFLPGKQHDPNAWVKFIRAYHSDRIHRFSWGRIIRRSTSAGQKVDCGERQQRIYTPPPVAPEFIPQVAATASGKTAPHPQVAKSSEQDKKKTSSEHESPEMQRYRELVESVKSVKEADELFALGILCPGTRAEATCQLAWSFVVARGMPPAAATETLCEWVYRTGVSTSKDVMADLKNGTKLVRSQTEEIVAWTAKLPANEFRKSNLWFSDSEVDAVLKMLVADKTWFNSKLAEVALRFLYYVKKNGSRNLNGWKCGVAVRSVMRKWRNCSGMRYKKHIDRLKQSGLIEMTREKRQSSNGTGWARIYQFRLMVRSGEPPTLSLGDAISLAEHRIHELKIDPAQMSSFFAESDTYREHCIPSSMDKPEIDSSIPSISTAQRESATAKSPEVSQEKKNSQISSTESDQIKTAVAAESRMVTAPAESPNTMDAEEQKKLLNDRIRELIAERPVQPFQGSRNISHSHLPGVPKRLRNNPAALEKFLQENPGSQVNQEVPLVVLRPIESPVAEAEKNMNDGRTNKPVSQSAENPSDRRPGRLQHLPDVPRRFHDDPEGYAEFLKRQAAKQMSQENPDVNPEESGLANAENSLGQGMTPEVPVLLRPIASLETEEPAEQDNVNDDSSAQPPVEPLGLFWRGQNLPGVPRRFKNDPKKYEEHLRRQAAAQQAWAKPVEIPRHTDNQIGIQDD